LPVQGKGLPAFLYLAVRIRNLDMSIRILIADDHTLFRETLRDTLSNKGMAYDVVGQAADGERPSIW